MDFSLSEEQEEVGRLARQILGDLSTHERLKEVEAGDEGVDRALWRELGKANLLGVALPEASGGSDMGFFTLLVLLEEVGRAAAQIPAVPALVGGALPVAAFGSDAQKRELLPAVAAGEGFLGCALQEAESDEPWAPVTEARPDGDGFRLTGTKLCVSAAHLAARLVVPACAPSGVGLFLVDPKGAGVTLARQHTTNREPHFELRLEDAPVAAGDVLVAPEPGADAARWLAERVTVGYCALQLGISDRAVQMTAEYSRGRIQFDRPIGAFQAVHQRAADAWIGVEAIRLTTWQAGWRLGEGLPASREVAVAKYWACEAGQYAGYAAQHLHGGIGIDVDYPLHRYYLWSKQIELSLGSAPVQLARLGADLAAEPLRPE